MFHFVVLVMMLPLADEMLGTETEENTSVRRVVVTTTVKMNDEIPQAQVQADQTASQSRRSELARPLQPQWWLGVNCTEIPAPLLEHLQIKTGLLVGCVAPESPAELAGIKPDDILLSFGSEEILSTDDLMGLVEASQGQTVAVELLRNGQRVAVEVTAGRRPMAEPIVLMVDAQGRPLDQESWASFEPVLQEKVKIGCSIVLVRPGVVIDREFDAVDADATFFPIASGGFAGTELGPQGMELVTQEFPMTPWVSRHLRWQNDQVQIGGNQIWFFPEGSQHDQVLWVGRTAAAPAEQIEFRGQTRIVAAFAGDEASNELELKIGYELRQWQQRTEELESQVKLLQNEVETLRSLIRDSSAAPPATYPSDPLPR